MMNWTSRHARKVSSSQSKPGLKSLEGLREVVWVNFRS